MRTSMRRALVPGIAALALAVTGCAASNDTGSSASEGEAELSGDISAGGASTQQAAMGAWAVGFQGMYPDVTVNYDPIGSGGGRENFLSGAFPFAGTDAYLSEDDGELEAANERCGGDYYRDPELRLPDRAHLQRRGRRLPRPAPRRRWRASSPARSPSGTTRRSRTTTPTPTCRAPRSTRCTAPTSPARPRTSPTTSTPSPPTSGTRGIIETWPTEARRRGRQGHLRRRVGRQQRPERDRLRRRQPDPDLAVANVGVGGEFVEPSAEAASKILEVSPAGRGPRRQRHGLRPRPRDAGGRHLPDRPHVLPRGLPAYDDQEEADMVKAYVAYVISDEGQQQAADEARLGPAVRQPPGGGQGHRRAGLGGLIGAPGVTVRGSGATMAPDPRPHPERILGSGRRAGPARRRRAKEGSAGVHRHV